MGWAAAAMSVPFGRNVPLASVISFMTLRLKETRVDHKLDQSDGKDMKTGAYVG